MQILRILCISLGVIFLFSCQGNQGVSNLVAPANLIPKDKMQKILVDIHLAESLLKENTNKVDSLKFQQKVLYKMIYQEFDVLEKQFESSFDYYKKQPEVLEEIYDGVKADITEFQADLLRNKNDNK